MNNNSPPRSSHRTRSSITSPPPMASNQSSSGSDLSTPRSSSPSSSSTASRSSATTAALPKRTSLSSRRFSSPFNPMAGVNIQALEDQMRIAALDGLKGYAQDHYGAVVQKQETQYISKDMAAGYQVLQEPAWNKGKIL